MVNPIITTTLPTIVGMGVVSRTTETMFKRGGRGGSGEGSLHWHYKGRSRVAVQHRHPGGHMSHMHRGLPGYGKTRKTLRR